MNSLEYEKALIFDKRTFAHIYFSFIRMNHLLIFSFYIKNKDYNVQIIKIFLFFFFFAVQFTINALFFNDNTIHQIYKDEGEFNFIYQISQIIYSSIVSIVINKIIQFLSLPEKNVLELKKENKIINVDKKTKEILKCLKIKFALFFIISFLFLLAFTFYITCFCGVFVNSQIYLIKDSAISFGLSLVYPFGIYLIPTMIRLIALRSKKKDKKCLYFMVYIIYRNSKR